MGLEFLKYPKNITYLHQTLILCVYKMGTTMPQVKYFGCSNFLTLKICVICIFKWES